ncbi:MAG TPA: class I SAM-dependent methyltransferase [Pirellulales bacterium]|nr:class I SAM-dependent methyltransferase [Pirellulales bacterium]
MATDQPHDASEEAICREAGDAAEALLQELTEAARLTSDWRDENVGFALLATAMDRSLLRLAASGRRGKANQLASSQFWSIAAPVLDVGWLQPRARHKPRGYAGDYEMFVRFWEHTCDDHPVGRLFDRYFQRQAAVEAVRSRTTYLAQTIAAAAMKRPSGREFRVASVGCGPAIELELAASWLSDAHRRNLRVTLLDFDPDALEHARRRLAGVVADEQIAALRENLYRLPDRRHTAEALDGIDLLYCAGLFDYLSDDVAGEMLRFFWRRLARQGTLLVGNFAPHNPTRAYMEWVGNWHLIYRTPDELAQLALAAGLPERAFTVAAEPLGIDLFLQAWSE